MNTISQTSGNPLLWGNWYVMLWSLFNVLILVAIVVIIFLAIGYLKKKSTTKKLLSPYNCVNWISEN